VLSITLGQDGKPAIPGLAGADMLSSMMTLSALLMALLRRRDTGRGDYIDVAMADSLFAAVANNMGTTFAERRAPEVVHERALGGYAMYQIYATNDGRHVVLGGSELHFAEVVLKALGRPDLFELCKPPPGPRQDPVKAFLRETFLTRSQAEWVQFFNGLDCAFAPIKTLREAADDAQLRHREMVLTDERGWEHLGIPMKFRHEPGRAVFSFAAMGEHTEQVLEELGYAQAERAALKEAGVW